MLYASTPFKGTNRHGTFSNVLRNEVAFPDHPATTTICKSVIKKLLWKDEHKRLGSQSGASEVKQHKWFSSINWGLLRHSKPPIIPMLSSVPPRGAISVPITDSPHAEQNGPRHGQLPSHSRFEISRSRRTSDVAAVARVGARYHLDSDPLLFFFLLSLLSLESCFFSRLLQLACHFIVCSLCYTLRRLERERTSGR